MDEEATLNFAVCVPLAILLPIKRICDAIYEKHRKDNYKAWLVNPQGEYCYCNSHKECAALLDMGYKFAHEVKSRYKIEDGWDKRDCCGDVVNLRYTPIEILKKENVPQISEEILEEIKKYYEEEEKREGRF